ncbi:MAG: mechanosensitive ion channel [Candidatus Aminicenantes bacterium]|nr:mechanosensitive ion channel [Candidatus Aminicenantes bacterium]
MTVPAATQSTVYIEGIFIFLAFVLAFVLFFLVRLGITRLFVSGQRPAAIYLSRLNLPAAFIFVSLCLKIPAVANVLFPSRRFDSYIEAALLFSVVFFLLRLIDASFQSWFVRNKKSFPLPKVLHSLILAVVYLVIFFIILRGVLGVNITPFLATSALLTMIIGLAFQGVLSNILSGMSLHLIKSFGKGDWISVGTEEGVVMDTNWRETRVLNRFSNIVVFPNNVVASEKITNFSLPDSKTALTISIKAGFKSPPSEVFEAIREAALDVPEVLAYPPPEAHLISYDDFGISYAVKFWITDFARKHPIKAKVGRNIWYKFKRLNIEIPVPLSDTVTDVMLYVDKERKAASVREDTDRNFADLMRSKFLKHQDEKGAEKLLVSEEDMHHFAGMVKRHRFAPGEVVFKQGDRGESCYILARGKIKGEISYTEKGKTYKSEFVVEAGGLFGEMSLFTGMPRTATGIVQEEAELMEIKAGDFAYLLEKYPELSEALAETVSKRNKENQEFLEKIKELSKKDIEESTSKRSILARLSSFVKRKI